MALSITDLHHPLYYWCLPQAALYIPSMKNIVLSANMTRMNEIQPLGSYTGIWPILAMLEKIGCHLWRVIRKVMHHCMIIPELLNTNIFLMCTEETVAMAGVSMKKTVGLEAQERPGWEAKNIEVRSVHLSKKPTELNPQMKNLEDPMTSHDELAVDRDAVELSEWLEWDSDEEEDNDNELDDDDSEDEVMGEQCTQNGDDEAEWSDEEDSDWSDDDGESETSAETMELWECFFNNDNPLYFSCSIGINTKSANTTKNCTASNVMASEVQKSTSADVEEHNLESIKKGTKKVQFSDEVKVHHLVGWSFASRAARDGSCWLEMARDRERFRRRVQRTGEVLNPCLTSQHRDMVWNRLQRGVQQEHF